jgi:microcystin-dependent protein
VGVAPPDDGRMSSIYPGAIDTALAPAGKTNATPTLDDHPDHHNLLADALEKVETELGPNPSGANATVADRLTAIEAQGGAPAGTGAMWFSNTPPPGWAILDGSTLTNAQTTYPALWANVDPTWKSGSDIVLPDMRGRVPVGRGTHADVDALSDNDGVAVASRRPKHGHSHTLAFAGTAGNTGTVSSDHTHSGTTATDSPDHAHNQNLYSTAGGSVIHNNSVALQAFAATIGDIGGATARHSHTFTTGGISANHTHAFTPAGSISGAIGQAGMNDSVAYQVVNFIIKL